MFSTFDCAVKGYRQKEDAWNAIISGFMTGGCLAARSEFLFLVTSVFMFEVDSSQMDGFLIDF
jgi:Tim17/Tim22/Tim23/Pmp24 family